MQVVIAMFLLIGIPYILLQWGSRGLRAAGCSLLLRAIGATGEGWRIRGTAPVVLPGVTLRDAVPLRDAAAVSVRGK